MKAYGKMKVWFNWFLTSAVEWVVSFTARSPYSQRKRTRYPQNRKLVGAQGRSELTGVKTNFSGSFYKNQQRLSVSLTVSSSAATVRLSDCIFISRDCPSLYLHQQRLSVWLYLHQQRLSVSLTVSSSAATVRLSDCIFNYWSNFDVLNRLSLTVCNLTIKLIVLTP